MIRFFLYYITNFFNRLCPNLNKRLQNKRNGSASAKSKRDVPRGALGAHIDTPQHNAEEGDVHNEVKVVKDNAVWECSRCFIIIKHRQNIARHQAMSCEAAKVPKIHPTACPRKKVYKCEHCDVKYNLKTSLTAHMKTCHLEQYCLQNGQSLFKCPVCDFISNAERFLKQHVVRYHMDKGSFTCEFCEHQYSNKDSLRVHIKKSHLLPEKNPAGRSVSAEPGLPLLDIQQQIGSIHGNISISSYKDKNTSNKCNNGSSSSNNNNIIMNKNKNYKRFNELMRKLEFGEERKQTEGGLTVQKSSDDDQDFVYEIPGGCVPDWLGSGDHSGDMSYHSEPVKIVQEGGKNYFNL